MTSTDGNGRREALDPVTLEVIRHGLVAAAEQMATSIERSAHSQVIREMLDYSTAVFDAEGGIVAQSTRIPMHLNSMTRALKTIFGRFPLAGWQRRATSTARTTRTPAGSTFPTSRPSRRSSTTSVPIAIAGTLGHHLDVGGRGPGELRRGCDRDLPGGLSHPALPDRHGRRAERALPAALREQHPRSAEDGQRPARADRGALDRRGRRDPARASATEPRWCWRRRAR